MRIFGEKKDTDGGGDGLLRALLLSVREAAREAAREVVNGALETVNRLAARAEETLQKSEEAARKGESAAELIDALCKAPNAIFGADVLATLEVKLDQTGYRHLQVTVDGNMADFGSPRIFVAEPGRYVAVVALFRKGPTT